MIRRRQSKGGPGIIKFPVPYSSESMLADTPSFNLSCMALYSQIMSMSCIYVMVLEPEILFTQCKQKPSNVCVTSSGEKAVHE